MSKEKREKKVKDIELEKEELSEEEVEKENNQIEEYALGQVNVLKSTVIDEVIKLLNFLIAKLEGLKG